MNFHPMLIEKIKVLFLKAERFDFKGSNGSQVVAYNCRLIHSGVVYKCRLAPELYEEVKEIVEENILADILVESSKEVVSLRLKAIYQ